MRRFRFLNHTGDIAIEIYGQTLTDLFENAAEAFFAVITDQSKVQEKVEKGIVLSYHDLETLMVDWLGEFLYLYDVERLLFGRFDVRTVEHGRFEAKAWGEFFQERRHVIRREAKAVTFHQLEVKERGGSWRARVILDL